MGYFPNGVTLNFHRSVMAIKPENLKKHLQIDCYTNVHSDSRRSWGRGHSGVAGSGGGEGEEEAKGNWSAN